MDLYRKNEENLDKEKSIKSLLRENELLNEKLSAVETDMKVILNNRQKIDNLEDIILKFIHEEKDRDIVKGKTGTYVHDETRYTDKNIFTNKLKSSQLIPGKNYNLERDNQSVPQWYVKLHAKSKNY